MSGATERVARAITAAEGVDPDSPCAGLGNLIPAGETWPAWRVRVPRAEAAMRETLALMGEWSAAAEDPEFFRLGLRKFAREHGLEG